MAKQRGPKPTPTAILKARGSWRAKDRPDADNSVPVERPVMPDFITGFARTKWYELCTLLLNARILTKLDAFCLARYCVNLERWKDICEWRKSPKYEEEKFIKVFNRWGHLVEQKPHPYLKMIDVVAREIRADERELGL